MLLLFRFVLSVFESSSTFANSRFSSRVCLVMFVLICFGVFVLMFFVKFLFVYVLMLMMVDFCVFSVVVFCCSL